jgi:rare lipoprotein A
MLLALIVVSAALPGCAPKPVGTLTEKALDTQTGRASFYGAEDNDELFAAHPSYPRGMVARVTNLENGRKVNVRISDRGPAAEKQAQGFIIDLSHAAAKELDFIKEGEARVRVEVLEWGMTALGRTLEVSGFFWQTWQDGFPAVLSGDEAKCG